MKVFLDTSVLVAAVLAKHEFHARAFAVLSRVQDGHDEGCISGHSLAEVYAILTRLPAPFRHSPEQALFSIEHNILKHFEISTLSGRDYGALIREAAATRVQGGTVYDAVLLKCASKTEVERIYTLNLSHFQALASKDQKARIHLPP